MKALFAALALTALSTAAYASEQVPAQDAVYHPQSSTQEDAKVIQAGAGYCCAFGLGTDLKWEYSCGLKLTGCDD